MRLIIFNITAGGISGGYIKYLRNVIPRLVDHPAVDELLCISPASWDIENWLKPFPNVEFVSYDSLRFIILGLNALLKSRFEKFSPDVIFVPTERFFGFKEVPVVNMLQNMEPLLNVNERKPFLERVMNRLRAYDAKKAMKNSTRIIAVSRFVEEFLKESWSIPKSKIGLVYYGRDHLADDMSRPATIPADWNDNFIFTAGSLRPARGLEDVLEAMLYLKDKNEKKLRLVVAGTASHYMKTYHHDLKRWVDQHGLSDSVCWVDKLNPREMVWCYQHCQLFIMSSRVESFGMIILEAMSQGCICLSADNPCLPEIFQDATVYYSPKDPQSLADQIIAVMNWNYQQRNEMREKAKKRAAEFSWDICVEKTVEELLKAINQ